MLFIEIGSVCLTSASLLPVRFIHAVSDGMGGGIEARGRDREGQERVRERSEE